MENLRRIIRNCLSSNKINPDSFTAKEIADFAQTGKLRMDSGVPIRTVITIGPMSDPVKIPVRDSCGRVQATNPRTGKPLFRYHFSRNNHHVEIMEEIDDGDWSGECVTTFDAARRVRPPKAADGTRAIPQPAVNRQDRDGKKFVMSLSEGETIHARRRDREQGTPDYVGYFVVAKLDATRIWFAPHWDARNADQQERWDVSYADLKLCGVEQGTTPYKVRVSSLGEITRLERD